MRNIFSKILISFFMLGIFLVPISANLNLQNALSPSVEIQTNTAEAWWGPGVSAAAIWNSLVKPIGEGIGWTVAQVIKAFLFLIFQALALLASILADILDFFIFYSIGSDVYRSTFVEAAWGTVRDVANIFFLLGLLYVAIQIVLDIGVSEKKKMIGNIIVMALLVNFSLFATQVVIDASNIVARVFYNQIESVDSTGKKLPEGKYLPKAVTVSLVSTFDPNKIISDQSSVYMDVLAYLIMVGIVGYMCYLFLVMTFLFVGRIVSLWVAMIFGPIAFMSRALGITALEDLSWKNWLHNLINSAMMAPLFIFFLYIILLLGKWIETLKKDIVIFSGQGDPFLAFISVLIPMAIIFTLLTKAKGLAIKYSGDIGKSLSSVGPALAGLALGGAALGTAALGRGTIGAVAKYSQNDKARDKDKDVNARINDLKGSAKWNPMNYARILGKGAAAGLAEKLTTKKDGRDADGKVKTDGRTWLGRQIETGTTKAKDSAHAKGALDQASKDVTHDKDAKYGELLETQQSEVRKAVDRDELSKAIFGVKFENLKDDSSRAAVKNRVEDFHNNEKEVGHLSADYNGKTYTTHHSAKEMESLSKSNADAAIGELVNALRKGTYDIRNLADSKFNNSKGLLGSSMGLTVGILAAVAAGIRLGFKQTKIDTGASSQKDFLKDISSAITSALKGISTGGGGGGHKKEDHGGGGHGGGGGGHH